MKHITTEQGVQITPDKVKQNSVIEVSYSGLLAQSGADEVYVHCGSSEMFEWQDVQDVKMTRQGNNSFSANVLVQEGKAFNVCFRDSSNNWDNNSGANYSFKISE